MLLLLHHQSPDWTTWVPPAAHSMPHGRATLPRCLTTQTHNSPASKPKSSISPCHVPSPQTSCTRAMPLLSGAGCWRGGGACAAAAGHHRCGGGGGAAHRLVPACEQWGGSGRGAGGWGVRGGDCNRGWEGRAGGWDRGWGRAGQGKEGGGGLGGGHGKLHHTTP